MVRCLLGIGGNLGDPSLQIEAALQRLTAHPKIQVRRVSSRIRTPPIGGPANQDLFLNAAVLIETSLAPNSLLEQTQAIEVACGRQAGPRWAPRPLDIDILLYGRRIVQQAGLRIPHPWMVARRFVLQPAAEIAPQLKHPLLGWTVEQLWRHLASAPPRFAVVGCPDRGLIESIAQRASAQRIEGRPHDLRSLAGPHPGPSLAQQLESLTELAGDLHKAGWNEPHPARPLLSEFWLDQSLVVAEATLSHDELVQFRSEFERVAAATAPPKLVVLAAGFLRADPATTGDGADPWLARLRHSVIAGRAAPYIEVQSRGGDDFVREVAGALIAMH